MDDKYLSIITNFGCHYSCPECIVRNNKLKMTPTEEYSSYDQLWQVLHNECNDCNWVSVSGGGDPLFHWWEHQAWWTGFFSVCKELGRKIELHTSYYDFGHDDGILMFPFEQFDSPLWPSAMTKRRRLRIRPRFPRRTQKPRRIKSSLSL